MGEQFRRLVDEELSAQQPPRLDGLVARAVGDGRRIRRGRALGVGSVAAAVVLVVTGGALLLAQPPPPHQSPSGVVTAGTDELPATPEALLELLTSLLPQGTVSGHAGRVDRDWIAARVYLNQNIVQISVARRLSPSPPFCVSAPPRSDPTLGSTPRPDASELPPELAAPGICDLRADGSYIQRFEEPDNCAERTGFDVHRPDGVSVRIVTGGCPTPGGPEEVPGEVGLPASTAVAIVSDSRWAPTMPADLVTAGVIHFPDLPDIPGATPG